jgi:hypothetical protein
MYVNQVNGATYLVHIRFMTFLKDESADIFVSVIAANIAELS